MTRYRGGGGDAAGRDVGTAAAGPAATAKDRPPSESMVRSSPQLDASQRAGRRARAASRVLRIHGDPRSCRRPPGVRRRPGGCSRRGDGRPRPATDFSDPSDPDLLTDHPCHASHGDGSEQHAENCPDEVTGWESAGTRPAGSPVPRDHQEQEQDQAQLSERLHSTVEQAPITRASAADHTPKPTAHHTGVGFPPSL